MSEPKFAGITKFDGKNYMAWKFHIINAMQSCDLYEFFTGKEKQPEKGSDKFKAWNKQDKCATTNIFSSITVDHQLMLRNCKTSAEMWTTLENQYSRTSNEYLCQAQQEFYNYRYKEGSDISSHLREMTTIVDKLRDFGEIISETSIISKIIATIPSRFNSFIFA